MNIRVTIFFIATFFLIGGGIVSIMPLMPKVNRELKNIVLGGKFQMRMGVYGFISVLLFALLPFDEIMLVGDLLPMIISLFLSLIFITGYIRISKHIDQTTLSRAEKILAAVQVPMGFLAIFTGIIHVIFPKIIIL